MMIVRYHQYPSCVCNSLEFFRNSSFAPSRFPWGCCCKRVVTKESTAFTRSRLSLPGFWSCRPILPKARTLNDILPSDPPTTTCISVCFLAHATIALWILRDCVQVNPFLPCALRTLFRSSKQARPFEFVPASNSFSSVLSKPMHNGHHFIPTGAGYVQWRSSKNENRHGVTGRWSHNLVFRDVCAKFLVDEQVDDKLRCCVGSQHGHQNWGRTSREPTKHLGSCSGTLLYCVGTDSMCPIVLG